MSDELKVENPFHTPDLSPHVRVKSHLSYWRSFINQDVLAVKYVLLAVRWTPLSSYLDQIP